MEASTRKHLCRILLSGIIVSFQFAAWAQVEVPKMPTVIPPSPSAAALGKYGSIPVSLHTGIPEISIPLHTIVSGSLQLPISLNYHAAGFRVSELAPWTGLGWTLFAGGAISRSAVGLGDDSGIGFLGSYATQHAADIGEEDLDFLLSVTRGTTDNESDIYFYNFAGRSGKFVLNDDRQPVLIPREPLDITYSSSPKGFTILTEDGTKYRFFTLESLIAGTYTPDGEESDTYTGTYYLTEIISADDTDHINFNYGGGTPYTINTTDYVEILGDRCEQSGLSTAQHDFGNTFNFRIISELYLESITFATGSIVFNRATDRTDFGPVSRLTEIIVHHETLTDPVVIDKRFTFQTGYFPNGASRLKLNSITELDASGNSIKKHEFTYNETAALPGHGSVGQDWWGYANGQTGTTLIHEEMLSYSGITYAVGGVSRAPNTNAMQAGILKKIKYPTGGVTEFDYEPHKFNGSAKIDMGLSVASGQMNNTTDLLEDVETFTPAESTWARVTVECSNVTDGFDTYFSRVFLTGGGQNLITLYYDPYTYPDYDPYLSKEYWVQLQGGVTYTLTVRSRGNSQAARYNGAAYSMAGVTWQETQQNVPEITGGLRIKEIRDYAVEGGIAVTKTYKYSSVHTTTVNGENDLGILITPPSKLGSFKQVMPERFWKPVISFCIPLCFSDRLYIYSSTPHDLTTMNGSAVVYPQVTVYEKNASAPNGRTISRFDVVTDEIYPAAPTYRDGTILLNNGWRGGNMTWTATFAGNTQNKISEKSLDYSVAQTSSIYSTKIGKKWVDRGCPQYSAPDVHDVFYAFDYPIYTGVKNLSWESERQYSSTDPAKYTETRVDYFYDNLADNHQQLSRKILLDSEGNTYQSYYWYPADYNNTGEITTLMDKHIIGVPLKEEVHRNNEIVSGKVVRLNADGKPIEFYQYESATAQVPPGHNPAVIVPTGYVKKADVTYDAQKNVQKIVAKDNFSTVYLWSYENTLPIAKAENCEAVQIATTSFESDGKGNWSHTGTATAGVAKTGGYYYTLGTGKNITKSLTAGKYKLEYWAKGTAITVAGGTITTIATSPPDANGWVLHQKEVNVATTATLTLNGAATAFIDELRVYPATAVITTFTYDIPNGISSITDPRGGIAYYEYDAFGRLKWVKDLNGQIVQATEYHYQGN